MTKLEQGRALLAAGTQGEWKSETEAEPEDDVPEVYVCHPKTECDETVVATIGRFAGYNAPLTTEQKQANAALITFAVNNLPALLDCAEAAAKALNYIANTEGELGIELDSGNALRAALAHLEGAQS